MATVKFLGLLSAGSVLVAVSIVAVAGPGSNSPFANKKPKAWEAPAASTQQSMPQYTKPSAPVQSQFRSQIQTKPLVQVPSQVQSQYRKPNTSYGNTLAGGAYYPGKKPSWQSPPDQRPQVASPYVQSPQTAPSVQVPPWANKTYQESRQQNWPVKPPFGQKPGQVPAWAQEVAQNGNQGSAQNIQNSAQSQNSSGYQPAYAGIPGYNTQNQPRNGVQKPQWQQQAPSYDQNYDTAQQASYGQPPQSAPALRGGSRPSWLKRLGGGLQTVFSGHAKVGVAAVDRSGAEVTAESIVDLDARLEVSAITEGGLEYGAGLRVRAQRDRYRRGFGGLVGDCPAGVADCASVLVGGNTRSVKGHTSQFYNSGPDDRRETQVALEGAYLFLRSAYGDFVVGRDDGSAFLFSIGAPSLVAVNASNSPVDYTGLDSVKTYNDASGFAEKIAYTSPRLLGDTVGVGVQLGLSYAPNARACGVDYCVRSNPAGALDPFAPEIKNIFEVGLALDRKFASGLSAELTGTYARGSEDSGILNGGTEVFDSLKSYGLGLELKYSDFTFGTSFLKSNNGFAGQGDYVAYDAGITWKPSNWGITASYGHADDDIANITSDQGVLALSYDLGKVRLGTGVQYIKRDVPLVVGAVRTKNKQDAAALFFEAGIDF
ncbi:MAG: hypothetical protein L3J65_02875 [Robiginitomaculum sp.]|nr:hypothetical protein [Robiginitomaculum sp.]